MKHVRYNWLFFLLATLILGVSCKKTPELDLSHLDSYNGKAEAERNGIPWSALVWGRYVKPAQAFAVALDSFNRSGIMVQHLGLGNLPLAKGKHYMADSTWLSNGKSSPGAVLVITNDDVGLRFYDIMEGDSSNHVTITHLDTTTLEVQGVFDLNLYEPTGGFAPQFPDTIKLRNGKFSVKLEKY